MSKAHPSPRALRRAAFRSPWKHTAPFERLCNDIASAATQAAAAAAHTVRADEWEAARCHLGDLSDLESSVIVVSGPAHWGLTRLQAGGEPAASWGHEQYRQTQALVTEIGMERDAVFDASLRAEVEARVSQAGRSGARRRKATAALQAYPRALPGMTLTWRAFAGLPLS